MSVSERQQQESLFPGYEPIVCMCGHPDPPPDAEDPTDRQWCQHVRFRRSPA